MNAFVNKPKQAALAQIPVRVILNEKAPWLGAVRYSCKRIRSAAF
jgi:glucokinase